MKKRPKERVERRKLADGTIKEYRYAARQAKPSEAKTVSKILGNWQRSPEWDALATNTAKAYIRYISPLYEAYKAVDLKDIKRRHILGLRDILAKNRGHGAAIQFCKVSAVFFKWCVDRELIEHSPATDLKGPLRKGEWTAWTLPQALKAEAELPPQYARAVFLGRHTGQRRTDLCRMRWDDFDGHSIHVIQQKTDVELNVPVTADLKSALLTWKEESSGLTILQQADGRPIKPDTLSVMLHKELRRIGLPDGLSIHGLRKLAAATLADAGCSVHEIAAITGHQTLGMVEHYTKSANQRTLSQSAILRLDDYKNRKIRKV